MKSADDGYVELRQISKINFNYESQSTSCKLVYDNIRISKKYYIYKSIRAPRIAWATL